ncbi:MAG: hypothetical protein ABIT47_00010 [Candidatus Paceibacterota bacterium]
MDIVFDEKGLVSITYRRHSNFHAHLRRGPLMEAIAPHIMRGLKYLLVMPNTGPIRTIEEAVAYYYELMEIAQKCGYEQLEPIMTLYRTEYITPDTVERIAKSSIVRAVKHYPHETNLTTGSGHGTSLLESSYQLDALQECGVPLLVHCETGRDSRGQKLHPRRGEAYMINETMRRVRDRHPKLRICIEHASTTSAIRFVKGDTSGNTVMTITPHHPNFNENDFGKLGAELKCKPIVQTRGNQEATLQFMISGDSRVIAGDDTAAHLSGTKRVSFEQAANGCFLAEQSAPFYAHAFLKAGAMDHRFERFMSLNGPRWWGLPEPDMDDTVTIVRSSNDMPPPIEVPKANDVVIPLGWKPRKKDGIHVGLAMK